MTAQFAELLEYKGKETALFCEPLEDYWDSNPPRPKITERSTACWRGYRGKWKIDNDGRLLLLGFEDAVTVDEWEVRKQEDGYSVLVQLPPRPLTLENLFRDAAKPIHATWYSGTLRCPLGEVESYVHQGYESTFQRDLLIEIQDGMFVSERERQWSDESSEPLNPDGYKAELRGKREFEEHALQWGRVELSFDLVTISAFSAGDDVCGLASLEAFEFWNARTKHKVPVRTMWFRIMSKANYMEFARERLGQPGFASRPKVEESETGFIDGDVDTMLDAPIWTMAYFPLENDAFQSLVNAVRQQQRPAIKLTLGPRPVVGNVDANGWVDCEEFASLTIEKAEIVRYEDAIRMQMPKHCRADYKVLDECVLEIERATRNWIQMSTHAAHIGFELARSFTAHRIRERVIDRDPPFDLRRICEAFVGPTLNENGEPIRYVHYRSTALSERRWFDDIWVHAANPANDAIPDAMTPVALVDVARWYVDDVGAVSPTLEWAIVDALLHYAVRNTALSGASKPILESLVSAYSYVADSHFNAGAVRAMLYRAIKLGARIESVVFDILDQRVVRHFGTLNHI